MSYNGTATNGIRIINDYKKMMMGLAAKKDNIYVLKILMTYF